MIGGASLRDELRQSLRPLGFGAAYKVLDMLIEHVLRANGAGAGRLGYATKAARLENRPAELPVPFDTRPDLWDRMALLYANLQEARHATTHRRAQANAAGDLEIYDEERTLIDTVTSTEIQSFAAAAHILAELVIDQADDDRRASIAAWSVNELQARHGLPDLPATDPNAARRRLVMNLDVLDDDLLRLDTTLAREVIDGQAPSVGDLELHAGERVVVGQWEDVPDPGQEAYEFHPASPPQWLSEDALAE